MKNIFPRIIILVASIILLSCERSTIEPANEVTAPPYRVLEAEETIMEHIDAQFFNTNVGISVGNGGKIIKTTDAGVTWTKQTSGVVENLLSVHFITEDIGWVVGNAGTILKTIDGGATWIPQVAGTTANILCVYFFDQNNGVCGVAGSAANGTSILKTSNGGATWTLQTKIMIRNRSLNFVYMSDVDTYFLGGTTGAFIRTTDSGNVWDTATTVGTTATLLNAHFYDKYNGYICGNTGTVVKADLLYNTYTLVRPLTEESMRSVFFQDTYTGYAAGNFGLVYKTTNGGTTWDRVSTGVSVNLYVITYPEETIGYVLGAKVIMKSK